MNDRFLEQLSEARLDAALLAAGDGNPVLVRARRPKTWDELQHRAVEGAMAREVVIVDGTAERPQDALLAAAADYGASVSSLTGVVRAPELRWTCFMADARAQPPAAWLRLAGAFASARAERSGGGPALVICLDKPSAPALCRVLDDGDFVGPAEAAVFVRSQRSEAGLLGEAADAASIEAARGDLELLQRLMGLPEAQRFDPFDWASREPASDSPAPLRWRGREESCPIWLAQHDPTRLRRRIWRGHVGVILPWLAEALAEFIARHEGRLPRSIESRAGETVSKEDYEWSEIAWLLRASGSALADAAHALRRARNDLAHGRPLLWVEATALPALAKRVLEWR